MERAEEMANELGTQRILTNGHLFGHPTALTLSVVLSRPIHNFEFRSLSLSNAPKTLFSGKGTQFGFSSIRYSINPIYQIHHFLPTMGICFSKKKKKTQPSSSPSPRPLSSLTHDQKLKKPNLVVTQSQKQEWVSQKVEEENRERKPEFVITPCKKKKQPITTDQIPPEAESKVAPDVVEKNGEQPIKDLRRDGGLMVTEETRMVPLRTSSCTKEEVESILIQCGRLSRSSSGKVGLGENGSGGGRRYSGSKRSYDFDVEKKDMEEEEWEKAGPPSSRPSPRRRASSRERESRERKRSNSRERGSSGGRRISRSPGRRSDGLNSTSSNSVVEKSRQPGKMISVPALEKGNTTIATNLVVEDGGGLRRRKAHAPSSVGGALRSSSPRSQSPANIRASNENFNPNQKPQALSRSSSKKTEHSPYRRNPMAEIDDNSLPTDQTSSRSDPHLGDNQKVSKVDGVKKSAAAASNPQSQRVKHEHRRSKSGGGSEIPNGSNNTSINRGVREQLLSYKAKDPEVVDKAKGAAVVKSVDEANETSIRTITRTRSSRRSSRDLDALLGFNPDTHLNPNSYTFLLLEDIQNYHQQTTGFSLPVCVSKARSILEAVADLNSSSSGNNKTGHSSNNVNSSSTGHKDAIVESEVVVKDDLMEPSLHMYVSKPSLEIEKSNKSTTALDMAPEESAGSNSFDGQPYGSSIREPNSIDSSDYCWTSSLSNTHEGIEHSSDQFSPWSDDYPNHQQNQKQQQQKSSSETAGRGRKQKNVSKSNIVISSAISNSKKKETFDHRQIHTGVTS